MKLVSGIVDSGFFAQSALSAEVATKDSLGRNISETYLTGVDLSDYATEDWVTGQGYLTAHQSLDGLMSADLLEISDNKITGYNGTAFAGQGGVTGDYELSAGSGISIVDYPLEQKTVISVTAQGGNPEVEQAVIDNSATWDSVTAKQDTLSFDYKDTAISSIDNSTLYDNSAHARITTLAGRISDLSSNKLDTTAFSDVSGTFLTAHQDISNKLDTTAFSDVSGSFLTAVPDTYLQNTDLTITDGKVTEISGVPLSAGDELPSGVMNTSALEYNAVQEISGYNGSAIAQYGAEKQWLVHDDTLVHAANSAQYALGVNLSAVAQLLGVDETVLWSGTATSLTSVNLSETLSNFKRARITFNPYTSTTSMPKEIKEFLPEENKKILCLTQFVSPGILNLFKTEFSYSGTTFNVESQYYFDGKWTSANNNSQLQLYEVIGIGRKQ